MRWLLLIIPGLAFGQYRLDVPLSDPVAIEALGGRVDGGEFGPEGWTTTSRDDRLVIPLPAGIPARVGTLHVRVANLEISESAPGFRAWMLVSLNPNDGLFRPTPAGTASVQAVYIDVTEDPTRGRQPRGYFNLFDPGCDDWRNCTGEKGAPARWLRDGVGPFVIEQSWDGPVNRFRFERPGGMQNRELDLAPTAPNGRIEAPQFYLIVNACGGSQARSCGDWEGPIKGGPLGVRYESVWVELQAECGDAVCSPGESCADCAAECPCPDAAVPDAAPPDAASPDLAMPDAPADAAPDAAVPDVALAPEATVDAQPADAELRVDGPEVPQASGAEQTAGCRQGGGGKLLWALPVALARRRRRS